MSELRTNRIIPRDGLVSGTFNGGGIIQVKQTVKTDVYSESLNAHTTASADAIQVAITPTRSDSKILILISAHGSSSYWGSTCCGAWQGFLMRNGSILVQGDADGSRQRMTMRAGDSDSNYIEEPLNFNYLDSPNTTSAVTYKTMARIYNSGSGGTLRMQMTETGVSGVSYIHLMEISA